MTINDYHDRIIFIGYEHRAKDFQDKHIIPIMREGYSVEYSVKDFNKNSELRQHTWCLRKIDNKVTEQTRANIKECLSNEIFNKAIKDTNYLDEIIGEYIWLKEQSEGLDLMVKQHLEKEDSM